MNLTHCNDNIIAFAQTKLVYNEKAISLEGCLIVLQIVLDTIVYIGDFGYVKALVAQVEILLQFTPAPGHQLPSFAMVQHTI